MIEKNSRLFNKYVPTIPTWFLYLVIGVSILPLNLSLIGFDFSTITPNFYQPDLNDLSRNQLTRWLVGPLIHVFLESTSLLVAVIAGFFTCIIFYQKKELSALLVSCVLIASGISDALHIAIGLQLLPISGSYESFLELSWTGGRLLTATMALFGSIYVSNIDLSQKINNNLKKILFSVISLSSLYIVFGYFYLSTNQNLIDSTNPVGLLSKPYELVPLVFLLLTIGVCQYWISFSDSIYVRILGYSLIPLSAAEFHMMLGYQQSYDHHFHFAHMLKLLSYSIFLIAIAYDIKGLFFKYFQTSEALLSTEQKLRTTSTALSEERKTSLNAYEAKEQFLANMNHELRTPLNAIIGYSEIILEELETPNSMNIIEITEDLNKITKSGSDLLKFIDTFLYISSIESGRLKIKYKKIETQDLLDQINTLVSTMDMQGCSFSISHVENVENQKIFFTDCDKIIICIENILSNAFKFSPAGKVELQFKIYEEQERYILQISIIDNGIGITKEQQKWLFSRFTQIDIAKERSFRESGLGLTLTQKLVNTLGGYITIDSQEGVGSQFSLHIPLHSETSTELNIAN